LKALKEIGTAEVSYRYDGREIVLKSFTLSNGINTPYVTGSSISRDTGKIANSLTYQNTGIRLRLMLKDLGNGKYLLDGDAQWSGLMDSGVLISQNVTAKSFSSIQMDVASLLKPYRPILISNTIRIPNTETKNSQAKVILFRILISPIPD
jgi:hypothetical protein